MINIPANEIIYGASGQLSGNIEMRNADPSKKFIIGGVEIKEGGGDEVSTLRTEKILVETPLGDTTKEAQIAMETNTSNIEIKTKNITNEGIIRMLPSEQSVNKLEVYSGGVSAFGTLTSFGGFQINPDGADAQYQTDRLSKFTQTGSNLQIETQDTGDINLKTALPSGEVKITPAGTEVARITNTEINLNQAVNVAQVVNLGTTTDGKATISQDAGTRKLKLETSTTTDGNINDNAIEILSQGAVDITANGTASFCKLAVGNTTKLLAYAGEVMLGPEGTNINRMIGGTRITEANTTDAKNEEAELKINKGGGARNDLEINTQGSTTTDGDLLPTKGRLVVNTDIIPNSTFTDMNDEPNPLGGANSIFYSENIKLFHDMLKFNQSWHYTTFMNPATQVPNNEGVLFIGGVNTTTTPPSIDNFTQYYNGYKTKTQAGGDVQAPLLALQNTAGFLTFEFFNSGSDTAPTAPFPLKSSFTSLNSLAFPATDGRGQGAPSTATNGYLGLKIDMPFAIPQLINGLTAPVQGEIGYIDSNVNLVWLNQVGTFSHNAQVIYNPLPSASGQFNFSFKFPNVGGTTDFTAVNYAFVYITYQPTHDLRQLN